MKTLVIIPTYNEKDNIVAIMQAVLEATSSIDLDLLVVDDNSPDGTAGLAQSIVDGNSRAHLLVRTADKGFAKSYIDGFKWALARNYDTIVEMDADFSHPPAMLLPIINEMAHYDFIIASRYVKGGGVENWSPLRRLISLGGSIYARMALNLPIKDLTGGFNFWSRKALLLIDVDQIISNGYLFQIELKYRAYKNSQKLKWCEYPFVFPDRREGMSKMSKKIFIEAFLKIWKLRSIKIS